MKSPFEGARWYILMAGLVAVLAILAFLQYRSSQQLSDAVSEQMRTTLNGALLDMRGEVRDDLEPICRSLQLQIGKPSPDDPRQYALRLALWRRTTDNPQLAANLYIWQRRPNAASLLRLDSAQRSFVAEDWPAAMSRLRERLDEMSASASQPSGWFIDGHVPALVHPSLAAVQKRDASPPALDWIIVQLNPDVLAKEIFPELTYRHFSSNQGLSYQVAVLSGVPGRPPIYSSDPGFPPGSDFAPDATLNLFAGPSSERSPMLDAQLPAAFAGGEDSLRLQLLRYSAEENDWRIVAQHREGSLQRAVASMFYRELAISFGVLVILGITLGLIMLTSARARRLAQVQVDFVAGVSHELRTPLTGILSAAQNVADGVVEGKEHVARYGKAIVNQAQQLSDLIEKILTFSVIEKGRHRYHRQRTEVAPLIEESLKNTAALAQSAAVTVERDVPEDLPEIEVDFKAMCQCLQNLIANAIKYRGHNPWLRVRAFVAPNGNTREVCIAVQDRGIGIEPSDLGHIFEPFYRAAAVTAAQIHGSGLGLPLAKYIAEAMGGSLTVDSIPGQGSTFTVHLPVPEEPAEFQKQNAKLDYTSEP